MSTAQALPCRVAILTNVVAPYRVPVYERIGKVFHTSVLYSGLEGNRGTWQGIEHRMRNVEAKRSKGITLRYAMRQASGTYDHKFLHINPGFFSDLVQMAPDAVISNEMGFRTLVALLYGTLFRKPVWVWWGGTRHTERHVGRGKHILRRLIAGWARRWISYGETSTEYLLDIGVSREAIVQIQNCVDEQVFGQSTGPAVSCDVRPVFLCVGQLIRRKGLDKLLESAARVQREGYRFTLLIVGDGPEKRALEDMVRSLALQDVIFHPPQLPIAMPAVYKSADYLVFPTLEDVWGLVVNEALLAEVPVLCSAYAGCARELVPPENQFDPLIPAEFDAVLKRALNGQAKPVNSRVIKPCGEVADMIVRSIQGVIRC